MDQEELEFRCNQIVYRKVFDDNECQKILEYYSTDMEPALSLTYNVKKTGEKSIEPNDYRSDYRKSMNKTLSLNESNWIKEKLLPFTKDINDNFFKLPSLKFNDFEIIEYKNQDEFKWHTDVGVSHPYSLRRISLVIFMSDRDEYEGGQLEFMPKLKEPLKMEKGYMIAFPSHKVHRVAPIISGTRRTLVNWLYEYRGN